LEKLGFESYVGHEATSRVLSGILGVNVPFNRAQASLEAGDIILIASLRKRLGEGQVLNEVRHEDLALILCEVIEG
ncbi:MAG: DUF1874 domain-containing protein, partial [Candidatus Pacearchaeota archaeon]